MVHGGCQGAGMARSSSIHQVDNWVDVVYWNVKGTTVT
jgi:hypothetical protein